MLFLGKEGWPVDDRPPMSTTLHPQCDVMLTAELNRGNLDPAELPPAMAAYKGIAPIREALLGYLERLAAPS